MKVIDSFQLASIGVKQAALSRFRIGLTLYKSSFFPPLLLEFRFSGLFNRWMPEYDFKFSCSIV